jgi:hypothetical protein
VNKAAGGDLMDNLLNHLAETQVTFDEIDQIIDA